MRVRTAAGVLALAWAMAVPSVSMGQTSTDTLSIIKEPVEPSNVEIAVRLSEETPLASVDTVVIGRDDEFADSLASGMLQGSAPLLLVPPPGPVPERVRDELARLGPERVILLGGEAALSSAVAQELEGLGYTVERRAGASRFETATSIAGTDAVEADTAILARAFPSPEATDPTQGFADALAAGGLAAKMGWPVLLTQSEQLTGATRAYLASSQVTNVKILGGEAAVSAAVADELAALGITVERLAGPDRASTALEVAKARGASTAADAARVLLVQGQTEQAWAGGFAAAAHSAHFDAPVVLAAETELPPATQEWLQSAAYAVDPDDPSTYPILTCVTLPDVCEQARVALGLPPSLGGPLELISIGPDGAAVGGNFASVSADGTVTPFIGYGPVVAGSPAGEGHVFVRIDEAGGPRYEQVDVRPDGSQPTGQAFGPTSVSADGRHVGFISTDETLVPGDPAGRFAGRGYLRDRQSGTTSLVTIDEGGDEVYAGELDVSDDGTVVSYRGQAQGVIGILHHDLTTGAVELVRLPDGEPFHDAGDVGIPELAGDGSAILFRTDVAILAEDTNGTDDMYVLDRASGSFELVSVASDGTLGDGPSGEFDHGISSDGQLVVFVSRAGNLAPGDDSASQLEDVILHDRTTGETTLLTRLPDRTAGNAIVRAPTISRNGRWIAFATTADLDGRAIGRCPVWRYDVQTTLLSRVEPEPLVAQNNCPERVEVADDGTVVFDTLSSFVEDDQNTSAVHDVYRSGPAA